MYEENNWAPRFIDLFWGLDEENAVDSYISLDLNRVRINVDESRFVEFDTWFGAPFNKDISNISDGTAKLRPSMDIEKRFIESLFNNAYSLDVFWNTKGAIKSFQSLEFKDESVTIQKNGELYHPVRYLHAEYDLSKGVFRHFDGAVHFYTTKDYLERRDSDFRHNEKNSNKIKACSQKAFKFNGSLTTEMWKEFSSQFFTGNPLIYEYFAGQYPDYLIEHLELIRNNH